MRTLVSRFLTVALAIALIFTSPLPAVAQPLPAVHPVAVLPGLKGAFTGQKPDNIGVQAGHLASCPASPNCVVSQGADADHAIAPLQYTTDLATARANLLDILSVVPRTKVVSQSDHYILAESESRLMGFVDDSEFYFPEDEKVIQVRAAARMGESDLGVNRRRIEQIRLAFLDLEKRAAADGQSSNAGS
ncbi:MAG: DUF1499 domain-containing protein [Cyanobacteria bacterium J06560_6]